MTKYLIILIKLYILNNGRIGKKLCIQKTVIIENLYKV